MWSKWLDSAPVCIKNVKSEQISSTKFAEWKTFCNFALHTTSNFNLYLSFSSKESCLWRWLSFFLFKETFGIINYLLYLCSKLFEGSKVKAWYNWSSIPRFTGSVRREKYTESLALTEKVISFVIAMQVSRIHNRSPNLICSVAPTPCKQKIAPLEAL